jgi:hypothetical protein
LIDSEGHCAQISNESIDVILVHAAMVLKVLAEVS